MPDTALRYCICACCPVLCRGVFLKHISSARSTHHIAANAAKKVFRMGKKTSQAPSQSSIIITAAIAQETDNAVIAVIV